jgi:hypothetical protein
MSTALFLLAAILPGDGSAHVSTELHEATLAELLSGSWSGTWTRGEQTDDGVTAHKGVFTMPMTPPAKMRLSKSIKMLFVFFDSHGLSQH